MSLSRKYAKKLREIESLQAKSILTTEECEKIAKKSLYQKWIRKMHTPTCIGHLPEDIQFIILSYLPPSARLHLLKGKYSVADLETRLFRLPANMSSIYTLSSYIGWCSSIFTYTSINRYVYRTKMIYSGLYKKKWKHVSKQEVDFFVHIILDVCTNYTKMYRHFHKLNKKEYTKAPIADEIYKCETAMLQLYKHILLSDVSAS
jgi:hypothetical protein